MVGDLRQAGAIEITPAMLEAGVDAWLEGDCFYFTGEPTYEDIQLVVLNIIKAALKRVEYRN
jgi:hypothetical protein